MNSPSFPKPQRRAADPTAFTEVETSELATVNGGGSTLANFGVSSQMYHDAMQNYTTNNPNDAHDGCGTHHRA